MMNIKYALKEALLLLAMAAAIYFGVHVVFQQITVEQTSMVPTLAEGQRIFINKLVKEPDRGDIIVFENPDNSKDTPLIKRVIGLPGEEVEVRSGFVYIDGSPLNETYIGERPHYNMPRASFLVANTSFLAIIVTLVGIHTQVGL